MLTFRFEMGGPRCYAFEGWRITQPRPGAILCRPGAGAFARACLWAALVVLLIAGLRHAAEALEEWVLMLSPGTQRAQFAPPANIQRELDAMDRDLRQTLSEDQYAEYRARVDAQQAERNAGSAEQAARVERIRGAVGAITDGLTALLALLGLYMPTSCLWRRIVIEVDPARNLSVLRWRLVPRTRRWPLGQFSRAEVLAQEVPAGGGRRSGGFRWRVGLIDQDGGWALEFCPDQNRVPPRQGEMSARTTAFCAALSRITGLPCEPPKVIRMSSDLAGGLRHVVHGPIITSKTYGSLEEMPPELREMVERARLAPGEESRVVLGATARRTFGRGASGTTNQFRIEDQEGNVRTYDSLDEMPPEDRASFEGMLRIGAGHGSREFHVVDEGGAASYTSLDEMPPEHRARMEGILREVGAPAPPQGAPGQVIRFKDKAGRVHTFNSPDEMPPEIRALYERFRGE